MAIGGFVRGSLRAYLFAHVRICLCPPCVWHPYSSFIIGSQELCVLTSLPSRRMTGRVNIDTLLIYFSLNKWPPKAENVKMNVHDAGVAPLWMVLIYLFGGNGKYVRESEWNKQLKELLDGRERGRTAIEGRGRACLTSDYTYIFWPECYALHFVSALSGLSFGDARRRNIETEEHPDHLCRHWKCHALVRGTPEAISVYLSFNRVFSPLSIP